MIAAKKPMHKILRGAHEALRAVRGDFEIIKATKVSFGCGCVFCDIFLPPEADGFHRSKGMQIRCTREGQR